MVAQGNHVIAHPPQGPQLRGVGGIDRLEGGTHGKVPGVHRHHCPAGIILFPFEKGGQPGIPSHIGGVGVEVVVGIVGEENGEQPLPILSGKATPHNRQGHCQSQGQDQSGRTTKVLFHIPQFPLNEIVLHVKSSISIFPFLANLSLAFFPG